MHVSLRSAEKSCLSIHSTCGGVLYGVSYFYVYASALPIGLRVTRCEIEDTASKATPEDTGSHKSLSITKRISNDP